jgi:hypothetical protein
MKKFITNIKAAVKWGLFLLPSAFFLASASAQVTPTTLFVLTNLPSVITSAGTTGNISNLFANATNALGTPTNNVIPCWQGSGMAFQWLFAGTNTYTAASGGSTNNLAIAFAPSIDGTNFCTSPQSLLWVSNQCNVASSVIGGSNFVSGLLNNFAFVAPYEIENWNTGVTNAIYLTNAIASHGPAIYTGYP